jgi:hypothetical protein
MFTEPIHKFMSHLMHKKFRNTDTNAYTEEKNRLFHHLLHLLWHWYRGLYRYN